MTGSATVQRRVGALAPGTGTGAAAPAPAGTPNGAVDVAQRPRAVPGPTAPAPPRDAAVTRGSGDTPAAGHRPVGALSDRDIDQLARLLAAPVSRLLRAELRLERERFGRLRDATR
ncbi:hypothetical protein [Frankia sp. AgKG'84/4]